MPMSMPWAAHAPRRPHGRLRYVAVWEYGYSRYGTGKEFDKTGIDRVDRLSHRPRLVG